VNGEGFSADYCPRNPNKPSSPVLVARDCTTQIGKEERMRGLGLSVLAVGAVLMTGAVAFAQSAPAKTGDSAKGKVLTDAKGMTLYVFDKDSGGKSACNGQCATNWPPLMAAAGAKAEGSYTVVTRDDGAKQWAYKGKPLYTWKNDKKAGDITGDGVANNAWHIATP
jgi:predicted lipoprotein with Yx(FWY)xxD motif